MSNTDFSNIEDDEKRIAAKTAHLADLMKGNDLTYAELQAKYGLSIAVDSMRRELLIEFLEDSGIMSKEQRLDFELQFHSKVESDLAEFAVQAKEHAARQAFGVNPNAPKLVDAHGRTLLGG